MMVKKISNVTIFWISGFLIKNDIRSIQVLLRLRTLESGNISAPMHLGKGPQIVTTFS